MYIDLDQCFIQHGDRALPEIDLAPPGASIRPLGKKLTLMSRTQIFD
jgi:hypothetical protein